MKTKILIGACALCFGSMAYAQQAPQQAPDPNAQVMPGPVDVPPDARPANPDVPRNPDARPGSPANPVTVGGNMTAPPAPQENYPVCKGAVQDRCINPGEAPRSARKAAGKRARR